MENKKYKYEELKIEVDIFIMQIPNERHREIVKMIYTEDVKKVYKKIPIKGENVETEIDISIEDAFRGKEQTIGVRTVEGKIKKYNYSL